MASTAYKMNPKCNPARPHDYIYDPLFTVSSSKDYTREAAQAAMKTLKLNIQPNYPVMFTDAPEHRNILVMTDGCPLPPQIDSSWDGRNAALAETPAVHVDVKGTDRCCFFQRPIIDAIKESLQVPEIKITEQRIESASEVPDRLKKANKSQQTLFRESSAQTSPWAPPYKVVDGSEPEILTLAYLSWGHGLPVGMHEVCIIERARKRQAWEKAMPEIKDAKSLEERRRIISELEQDEWKFREEEIQSIQDARLELAHKLLDEAHLYLTDKLEDRLDKVKTTKLKESRKKIAQIRHNARRALRKLDLKHAGINMKYKAVNVIEEYVDHKSELYAPLMRHGEHPKRWHEKIPIGKYYIPHYQGVEKMDTLPHWLPMFDEIKSSAPKKEYRQLCIRETKWTKAVLAQLHEDLRKLRLHETYEKRPITLRRAVIHPPPPPPTPEVDSIPDWEEEEYQATIFIQKVIRGRAIQSLMFEGRDKLRELIEELKSTHALLEIDVPLRNEQRFVVRAQQRAQAEQEKRDDKLNEILSYLEGSTLSTGLDFLNKELLRLQDERRAHAFALIAMRERWKREAAEAGRRQKEERRRREHDEMFKQMMKVKQDTVDMYLEDIIMEGMDWVSEEEAKNYIYKLADKIDKAAEDAYESTDFLEQEEMTANLIHNFMLPEVEKQIVRQRMKQRQSKHLINAHNAIYEKLKRVNKKDFCAGSIEDKKLIKLEDEKTKILYTTVNLTSKVSDINEQFLGTQHMQHRISESNISREIHSSPAKLSIQASLGMMSLLGTKSDETITKPHVVSEASTAVERSQIEESEYYDDLARLESLGTDDTTGATNIDEHLKQDVETSQLLTEDITVDETSLGVEEFSKDIEKVEKLTDFTADDTDDGDSTII